MCSVGMLTGMGGTAHAATAIPLGTADDFAILAGSGITSAAGTSSITGDIASYPTTSVPAPGLLLLTGSDRSLDTAVALDAKADLLEAYGVAAGQPETETLAADLAGRTLFAGVYQAPSSMGLSGALTLDAQGDPHAVFVFQAGTSLTTGPGSSVVLINEAQACNVYWQVGTSATLDTTTVFRGNILADTSVTLNTGASVEGRVLASDGLVSLDNNVITRPGCTLPDDDEDDGDTGGTPTTGTPPTTGSAGDGSTGGTPAGGPGSVTGSATYGQISRVPVGSVDTGDGSAARSGWIDLSVTVRLLAATTGSA